MRRVVSLFLPFWPAERRRRQSPPLPDGPLLIAERIGGRRQVMAVDAAAWALGLRPGMQVGQAQAMRPGLLVVEADPQGDARGLAQLAFWCVRHFSPFAAPCPPDGVWIDITGCGHLFGGEPALLLALSDRLRRAGFTPRIAIADTPGGAHAAARFGAEALMVVPKNAIAATLAELPVAALRLDADIVAALHRLGFERIAQLMQAPRAPLARRFGTPLFRLLDQALGHLPEPIEPAQPPHMPRARLGFPEPIATPEDLARATTLLTQALCEKLVKRGVGARQIDLVFTRIDGVTQSLRIGTATPTRDPTHLARLLLPGIETIDPGFGIEAAMLAASRTDPLSATQAEAWAADGKQHQESFAWLADTLLNRLGAAGLYQARPVQSDIPERAVRRVSPLAPASGASWPDELPRPARLLSPPRDIEVMALLPDHPPVRFIWRGRTHRVCRADGPERIHGEWWHDEAEIHAARDYFQVEDETGQRFWLFRSGDGADLATGGMRWFLHGIFG